MKYTGFDNLDQCNMGDVALISGTWLYVVPKVLPSFQRRTGPYEMYRTGAHPYYVVCPNSKGPWVVMSQKQALNEHCPVVNENIPVK